MKPSRSCFDQAYLRWRGKLASFEARCFETLCEFLRAHFDDLLDHFYLEGHESLEDFPAWAFERYIQDADRKRARDSTTGLVGVVNRYEAHGGSRKRTD